MRETVYKPNELPQSITLPVTVYYAASGWDAGTIGAYCFDYQGTSERVVIAKTEATFQIPPQENLKGKVIDALEDEKREIQAQSYVKIRAVQDKIDTLLAIEYKAEGK